MTRNFPAVLAALAVSIGAAQAQDKTGPLVGPGVAGAEKDEKGRVKGVGDGGPHREFNMQFERRVDRPDAEAEKDRKEKGENARSQGDRGQTPNSGSGNTASGK